MNEDKKEYRKIAFRSLAEHLGEEETPKGSNMGPVVDWAVTPWAGKSHGAMPWCAGAVSTAYLEAEYPSMNTIGSLSCDALYRHVSSLPNVKILKKTLWEESVRQYQDQCEEGQKIASDISTWKEKLGFSQANIDFLLEQKYLIPNFVKLIEYNSWSKISWSEIFGKNAGFFPYRGDIIFFGDEHNLHHVGLVDALFLYKKIDEEKIHFNIITVEGNHGDGVNRCQRDDFFAIVRLP